MNKYYVSIDVGVEVEGNDESEATQKAYDLIASNDNGEYDDYTIIGKPKLVKENIERICLQCGKIDVGGSNDKMCPPCFKKWSDDYDRRHKQ